MGKKMRRFHNFIKLHASAFVTILFTAFPLFGAVIGESNIKDAPNDIQLSCINKFQKYTSYGYKIEEIIKTSITNKKAQNIIIIATPDNLKQPDPSSVPREIVILEKKNGAYRVVERNNTFLLCPDCLGAIGREPIIRIIDKDLYIDQLTGSIEATRGEWTFRYDKQQQKFRLLEFTLTDINRGTGDRTEKTFKFMLGYAELKTFKYDKKTDTTILTMTEKSSIDRESIFLTTLTKAKMNALGWYIDP